MAGLNKITIERNQKTLLELVSQPVSIRFPYQTSAQIAKRAIQDGGRITSGYFFGIVNCASIHRKIGTHITKIKSITMDAWTKEQVEPMKSIGNVKSNAMYNPNEARNPPPANLMDAERDSELEQYIRSKYQFKRFMDRSALVASKLGPSRSSAAPPNETLSNGNSQVPFSSAVSSPSVSVQSPHTTAPRRSTIANSVPPQVVSQPSIPQFLRQPQAQSQPHETSSTNGNGVWADLISLQSPSSSSSLPLQFQAVSQPTLDPQVYQTSMVTSINSFQQHLASNPYSHQPYPTSGLPGPPLPSGMPFSTPTALGSSQHQSLLTQQPLMSAPAVQVQNNSNFFQPQPQQALAQAQIQAADAGQMFFAANNGQSSNLMTAPTTQGHFLSSSPAQFPSQSPVSNTPQPHMFSTTPQPQVLQATIQSQVQPQMMFMTTPSQQFQMQQQGGLGVGSLQMTPVATGQLPFGTGPLQPQVTTMQPSGQFGGALQPSFSVGGSSSGQQWGPM
ncbi:UBA domain-containing protein 3 [Termitomyces sp. T112]|nr:UBA domain-containing protein 3 [Termitomyces sp. T112]